MGPIFKFKMSERFALEGCALLYEQVALLSGHMEYTGSSALIIILECNDITNQKDFDRMRPQIILMNSEIQQLRNRQQTDSETKELLILIEQNLCKTRRIMCNTLARDPLLKFMYNLNEGVCSTTVL